MPEWMIWVSSPEAWLALATLTILEIVLGIDNIIFITILVGKLPAELRNKGRIFGLGLAMVTRILLLLSLAWVMKLKEPILWHFSGRDLILLGGGLFLIWKSTHEIHHSLEGHEEGHKPGKVGSFTSVLIQIALIDIIFSLDSVITAVGLAKDVAVMVIAILISVGIMMFAAKSIGDFVDRNPTLKILALSFLILVGLALTGEGLEHTIKENFSGDYELKVPKGYIYFAMAFSFIVEMVNIRMRKKGNAPIKLHKEIE
jgi:predicted tellurium resistance membrane protein TerC